MRNLPIMFIFAFAWSWPVFTVANAQETIQGDEELSRYLPGRWRTADTDCADRANSWLFRHDGTINIQGRPGVWWTYDSLLHVEIYDQGMRLDESRWAEAPGHLASMRLTVEEGGADQVEFVAIGENGRPRALGSLFRCPE